MGVMPCNRDDCDNILVYNDLRNRNGDRICNSCLQELENALTASRIDLSDTNAVWEFVEAFMETPPGRGVGVDRRQQVQGVLGRIVDRRE